MKVKDILSGRAVVSVRDDDTLGMATQIMLWAGIRHLPVLDPCEKLVGLLDERDILMRHTTVGRAADLHPVRSAMLPLPATATVEEEVSEAAQRMLGRGVSALVIIDKGKVAGMLTTTDLVQHLAAPQPEFGAAGTAVRNLMHADPVAATADDHLLDALSRMAERNVRHLPVLDGDGKVVGILSDRDIRTAIGDPARALDAAETRVRLQSLRVAHVMSQPAVTVQDTAPFTEAVARFVDHQIGALPVVNEAEHLVGIVSYVDLLRMTLSATARTGSTPPAQV